MSSFGLLVTLLDPLHKPRLMLGPLRPWRNSTLGRPPPFGPLPPPGPAHLSRPLLLAILRSQAQPRAPHHRSQARYNRPRCGSASRGRPIRPRRGPLLRVLWIRPAHGPPRIYPQAISLLQFRPLHLP
ncbi:unnamed protein product [Linum trigynum]|uniref:Uncharacterized protein n=1 Tax=Linum trigynum TaxID=586398 RepID=A0AAV2EEF5_9ROSI